MKRLVFLFLFAVRAMAADLDFSIHSVWEEQKKTEGKEYLALVGDPAFAPNNAIVIFGGDKFRLFNFGNRYASINGDTTLKGQDNFYEITVTGGDPGAGDPAKVTLTPKFGKKKKIKLTYDRVTSPKKQEKILALATDAVTKAFNELKALEKKAPENKTQFKRLLDLVTMRYYDYSYYFDHPKEKPFPTYDGQISASASFTPPSRKLAAATISENAKDAISKYLHVTEWSTEEEANSVDWETEKDEDSGETPTYWYYNEKAKEALVNPLKTASEKFVKYEIVEVSGFSCEDSWTDVKTIRWVLEDGSVFTYDPEMECD